MIATEVISQFGLGVAGYYCSTFLMVRFVSSIRKSLWKNIVCSGQGPFSVPQGIRKGGSQKHEHTRDTNLTEK